VRNLKSSVNLGELVDAYSGRTTAEADRMNAPYMGAWVRLEAAVRDVEVSAKFGQTIVLEWPEPPRLVPFSVLIVGMGTNDDRVPMLRVGQIVELEGRIGSLGMQGVQLREAVLLPPQDP
jgi:hypothetical protein